MCTGYISQYFQASVEKNTLTFHVDIRHGSGTWGLDAWFILSHQAWELGWHKTWCDEKATFVISRIKLAADTMKAPWTESLISQSSVATSTCLAPPLTKRFACDPGDTTCGGIVTETTFVSCDTDTVIPRHVSTCVGPECRGLNYVDECLPVEAFKLLEDCLWQAPHIGFCGAPPIGAMLVDLNSLSLP